MSLVYLLISRKHQAGLLVRGQSSGTARVFEDGGVAMPTSQGSDMMATNAGAGRKSLGYLNRFTRRPGVATDFVKQAPITMVTVPWSLALLYHGRPLVISRNHLSPPQFLPTSTVKSSTSTHHNEHPISSTNFSYPITTCVRQLLQ